MDLSETLTQVKLGDKVEENRVKQLLEMSAKKYNLQKELEDLKLKVSLKRSEFKRAQKEVILLSVEVPVLERQEELIRCSLQDLAGQYAKQNMEIAQLQGNFWRKINNFVSDCNWIVTNQEGEMRSWNINEPPENPREERENKIRQLKVQSELEAMHLYEKYQSKKLEELKLMRELLEKDSFVI